MVDSIDESAYLSFQSDDSDSKKQPAGKREIPRIVEQRYRNANADPQVSALKKN